MCGHWRDPRGAFRIRPADRDGDGPPPQVLDLAAGGSTLGSPPRTQTVEHRGVWGGAVEKAWAAWLKIEPGSLASVQRDGADGMKDLGAGGLSAFPVLSATLTLPPPPTFSRWGGAEVWVQVDSPLPPIFFFISTGVLQS